MHTLAHSMTSSNVWLFAAFFILPLVFPALSYAFAGVIWRRRHYWRKRRLFLLIFYGLLFILTASVAIWYGRERDDLVFTAWSTFSLVGGLLFLLPPERLTTADPTLCPTCAYDLRANHPGDKCPECGTPIAIIKEHTP